MKLATALAQEKRRNLKLRIKIERLITDCERAQDTIDILRGATGPHKCPVCKAKRPFIEFPKEPRFVVGRDLRQCKYCHSKRIRMIQDKNLAKRRSIVMNPLETACTQLASDLGNPKLQQDFVVAVANALAKVKKKKAVYQQINQYGGKVADSLFDILYQRKPRHLVG